MGAQVPQSPTTPGIAAQPQSVNISTLTEYIRYVETNSWDQDTVLFRGQGGDWPLRPKIARLSHRISNEARARARVSVPDKEREMLDDFKLKSAPLLTIRPESDWEWLALAQHHGMATRLLDWSYDCLAALWFAVARPPEKDKRGVKQPAVVWVLKPGPDDVMLDPTSNAQVFDCAQTKVVRVRHITSRIVAQAGWFTVHRCFDTQPNFRALDTEADYSGKLVKLVIRPEDNNFGKLRYMLDRCGVNHSSIYPDLGGLSSHIEWNHIRLEDEPADMWTSPPSGGSS